MSVGWWCTEERDGGTQTLALLLVHPLHSFLVIQPAPPYHPDKDLLMQGASLYATQFTGYQLMLMMHSDIDTSWMWQLHSSNVIVHLLICTQRSSLTGGLEKGRLWEITSAPLDAAKTATLNWPIIHPVSGLTDAVDLSAILRLSVLQVRKLQDKVSKCQEAVKKSKENYELALLDITNYNSR